MRCKVARLSGVRRRSLQHIGRAHAAQIAHQRKNRLVAHGQPVGIDHRQSEAGALQQRAQLAQIGERRDPRRDAAFDLAFGLREGFAQFGEAVAADQRRQQQAVRLQRAADLDQRAGQIIDELQRQRRHDQIERAVGERQGLLVGGDAQRRIARPGGRRGGNRWSRPCRFPPARGAPRRSACRDRRHARTGAAPRRAARPARRRPGRSGRSRPQARGARCWRARSSLRSKMVGLCGI